MVKTSTIAELFKRKIGETSSVGTNEQSTHICDELHETTPIESRPTKILRPEPTEPLFNSCTFERDPGLRRQIWEYPLGKQNEIRRAYIAKGPYQPVFNQNEYKKSGSGKHVRSFQVSWFDKFRSWLEYSPKKDAAFCFVCFLFNKPDTHRAFTIDGFNNWKNVMGKKGAFLIHVGTGPTSPNQNAIIQLENFLNQERHLPNIYARQTSKDKADNRLRLESSIKAVPWLAMQGLAMRGRDESKDSSNMGNFLELLKYQASFNKDVNDVLNNAPGDASYTSPKIQKEILHILSEKIKRSIKEEVEGKLFCIIVDEAGDVSGKQQMAIILRFVDNLGLVKERFFSIIHVPNTNATTLKTEIFKALSTYGFNLNNLRGQGYDGASNMRGKWNGLQALVIRDCPYAYFVHCFAHRLQLALVTAAKEIIPICQFFTKLSMVINVILASYKRIDGLRNAYTYEVNMLIEDGELETGTELNQVSNLQRPGDTRLDSHLRSISNLIKMFGATCAVLHKLINEGDTSTERAQASMILEQITYFEFVFILHIMKNILEISDLLSQALQRKSQDILNSLHLVESTKALLKKLRTMDGNLLHLRGGRARNQANQTTVEEHYRVDLFIAAIDVQLQELNHRFNENSVELLTLSCALEPRESGGSFKVDDICSLVNKFYPGDFTEVEKEELRVKLSHYVLEFSRQHDLKNMSTISELSEWLVKTGKMNIYPIIFRLVKLLLTLPVSTASAERAFS